jgi:hypothetical protein
MPAQALQAFAPWLFGLALERSPATLMALSCAISAAGVVALLWLRLPAAPGDAGATAHAP